MTLLVTRKEVMDYITSVVYWLDDMRPEVFCYDIDAPIFPSFILHTAFKNKLTLCPRLYAFKVSRCVIPTWSLAEVANKRVVFVTPATTPHVYSLCADVSRVAELVLYVVVVKTKEVYADRWCVEVDDLAKVVGLGLGEEDPRKWDLALYET